MYLPYKNGDKNRPVRFVSFLEGNLWIHMFQIGQFPWNFCPKGGFSTAFSTEVNCLSLKRLACFHSTQVQTIWLQWEHWASGQGNFKAFSWENPSNVGGFNPYKCLKHQLNSQIWVISHVFLFEIKHLVGGWTNTHVKNMLIKMGNFPKVRGEKNYLKPPPRSLSEEVVFLPWFVWVGCLCFFHFYCCSLLLLLFWFLLLLLSLLLLLFLLEFLL